MRETLRRDVAIRGLVAAAGVIAEGEAPAREHGFGEHPGHFGAGDARRDVEDADAGEFVCRVGIAAREQLLDALAQRRKPGFEYPRLDLVEQLQAGDERKEFGGVEPQAGQFVAPAFVFGIPVAAAFVAPGLDRRAEIVAHLLHEAAQRRRRALEQITEPGARHRAMRAAQRVVQGVDAAQVIHMFPVSHHSAICSAAQGFVLLHPHPNPLPSREREEDRMSGP